MAERSPQFHVLGEKTLHHAADPSLVTYCPTMDLVAIVTTDQQVSIYRLNGQRVYGALHKKDGVGVQSIQWKPNGQLLAIAWTDGSVRLINTESSKTVLQFSTGHHIRGVTCMAWTTNFTRKRSISSRSKEGTHSWASFLAHDGALSDEKAPLDLPQDLSLIDIEISLPKLSVLAAGGTSEDVFSSRTSLDALFSPFDPKDNNSINVMVVGTKEGNIHLSIYDSFELGSFTSPVMIGSSPTHLVRHASHSDFSTHALLMKPPNDDENLYFVPMDLRFIPASSQYLSLLASRSSALSNLLRYIRQVQNMMVSEWKSTQDLPGKFLRNINETLAENGNRDIVQALCHSVATGHTFPAVREWLVDELSERGHKRWDKAVTTGLENLRRLVHENMLPALERCSIILSRFAGIVKFQGSNRSMGFTSQQISCIMDTVACLHLVSSKILIQVVDELELFASFSSWLRHEIDRLASDASASPSDDGGEKEASIDHSRVLLYLQTVMISSPLATYLDDKPSERDEDRWTHAGYGLPMFDLLDQQIQKQEQGLPYITLLPRASLLCDFLDEQSRTVFKQIAEAEKRNVLFGKTQHIGSLHSGGPVDMRMSPRVDETCQTHTAFVPKGSPSTVQVVRTVMSIENGVSSVEGITSSAIQLGDGQVRDVKFLDDSNMLVLWESSGSTKLLNVSYNTTLVSAGTETDAPHRNESAMKYMHHAPDIRAAVVLLSNKDVVTQFSYYRIPGDGSFTPGTMEVREQTKGRGHEDSRRLFILGKDKVHYKILRFEDLKSMKDDADVDVSMS